MKKIFIIAWTMCMIYFAALSVNYYSQIQSAIAYRYGSRGQVVREIQSRLKRWGYYKGSVDGIYGYRTYLAVKSFQRKNGLRADGIAGNRTLAALGINPGRTASSRTTAAGSQNLNLLARLINGEARGEPYIGQVAVGGVIMNRVRDPRFPNTIPGVIYQPGAFTAIVDGQIHARILPTSQKAAQDALNGWDPSGGALYYYNPAKTTNKWIWSRPIIKRIGKHVFCK
ncbi:N-acetylmuramoyl-L-alanine amidase [Fonticella tunisiensis]|uniref:Spore cortex-lytic enzyme n=2 Tax=Fonticella tunisiensis TaxID=1096341 RepID=A0A4R7KPG2_9CLOT|nr:N-acetylmuramoyl-L-alanine amidase [Fonticella tunisiensis]